MVFIKLNSLKSDIFFNTIFIPCFAESTFFRVYVFQGSGFLGFRFFQGPGFSRSRLFMVQVFQAPGFSGSRLFRVQVIQGLGYSGSRIFKVQGPGPGFKSSPKKTHDLL